MKHVKCFHFSRARDSLHFSIREVWVWDCIETKISEDLATPHVLTLSITHAVAGGTLLPPSSRTTRR
jgi:hypothetical protein